jgi:hypothetical protein
LFFGNVPGVREEKKEKKVISIGLCEAMNRYSALVCLIEAEKKKKKEKKSIRTVVMIDFQHYCCECQGEFNTLLFCVRCCP